MIVCPECGREPQARAEGDGWMETHWLGCSRRLRAHARSLVEASRPGEGAAAPPPRAPAAPAPATAAPKRRGRPPKKRVSE